MDTDVLILMLLGQQNKTLPCEQHFLNKINMWTENNQIKTCGVLTGLCRHVYVLSAFTNCRQDGEIKICKFRKDPKWCFAASHIKLFQVEVLKLVE